MRLNLETLESRDCPALVSVVDNGTVVTFTFDAANDALSVNVGSVTADGTDYAIPAGESVAALMGVGTDTLDFSNAGPQTVTLTGPNTGNVVGLTFASAEKIIGSPYDDTFSFASNAASITGTITGNGGTDTLDYSGRTGAVRVNLNSPQTAGATGGIIGIINVTGGSGNDILIGDGNGNVMSGGASNDILIGNGGDDTLSGGDGLDLLFGGAGADTLDGGAGDDLLVSGTTNYDASISGLTAIQLEWTRPGVSYTVREGRIHGDLGGGLNGSFRLNSGTVHDDGAADVLTGDDGQDWFITSPADVTDQEPGEIVTVVELKP